MSTGIRNRKEAGSPSKKKWVNANPTAIDDSNTSSEPTQPLGTRIANSIAKFAIIGSVFSILTFIELEIASKRPSVEKMVDHLFLYFEDLLTWFHEQEKDIASGVIAEGSLEWWLNPATLVLTFDTVFLGFVTTIAVFIVLSSKSTRVGSAMILNHSLRAVCLVLVEFPTPENMLWRKPGFPSEGANDYFYSGHMSIPIVCAMELSKRGYTKLVYTIHFLNFLQFLAMVTLRWHWTGISSIPIYCVFLSFNIHLKHSS